MVLGEGGDLFTRAASPSLAGTTPAESRIGEQTGLNVVAIEEPDAFETDLSAVSSNPFCNGVILSGALGAHARPEVMLPAARVLLGCEAESKGPEGSSSRDLPEWSENAGFSLKLLLRCAQGAKRFTLKALLR